MDLTATNTATLTGLSIRRVNDIFLKIRHRIAEECQRQAPYLGEVEVDESYSDSKRVLGKRGRGAGGKTIVKRDGHVFTEIVRGINQKRRVESRRPCRRPSR